MELRGYDRWKTTEPERDAAPVLRYRCIDCDWTGDALGAAAHHYRGSDHHRIRIRNGPEAVFSCCPKGDAT